MSFYEWFSIVALILAGFWAVGMALLSAYKKTLKEQEFSRLTQTKKQNEILKREIETFKTVVLENKIQFNKLVSALKAVDEKLKIAKEDISKLITHVNITDKNFDTGIKETIRAEILSHVVNRDYLLKVKREMKGE